MQPHQFIPIYTWMFDLGLTGNQLVIYALVWLYSVRFNKQLSISDIAKLTRVNRTTVYRALIPLVNRHIIASVQQDGQTLYITDNSAPRPPLQNATAPLQNATTPLQNATDNRIIEYKEINKENDKEKVIFDSKNVSPSDNATPEEHEMTAEEKQEAAVARDRFFERMGALTGNLKAGGREAKQQRQLRDEIQHAPTTPPPSPAAQAQRLLREAYDKGARAAESFDYDAFLPLARQIYARQPELLQECIRGYRDAKK